MDSTEFDEFDEFIDQPVWCVVNESNGFRVGGPRSVRIARSECPGDTDLVVARWDNETLAWVTAPEVEKGASIDDPVIEFYGRHVTLTHWSGFAEDGTRITVAPHDDPWPGATKVGGCSVCHGAEWVCEIHPDLAWSGVSLRDDACPQGCIGPGMPCQCSRFYEG